ncbi:unnamed protein product [Trichogramma brassicae]|uniref:Uncharacterized protein n=1 Tax=Trichogramma brassicae TaxID=86971 RepID=A0A6H5JB71_9HYME|nr:unnamed protein product [Trichogramma brassicae]
MENYADCMNRLMKESRENRALRREVNTSDFQAVKDKLLARYCSVFGAKPLLRERLLRARLREIPSLADRVPWFEFDNYDPDAELNYIPTENVNHSRRSHNESEKRTQLQPSSSDDDANQPTRIVVEAEIHKPPNKIEPFANMSRRSGVTVQPSQPLLEPLELIHSLPLQLPIDKEVLKTLCTQNYQFIVAERFHEHLIEPNAIKSSKHTDKVRAPSTWTPMKPCKTPRVKSQPENMTATHGWNPAMHTLNRTDHTTSAITESREEEVMGSHALPMQPATRRRVSTTHRPSSSVGHRHDDADVNNSMQTDRTAASHRAVFKPRTYAYNKVPSSTPFELYSRDTRSQRLPSTNRSRAQPLRRVINYPDVDETDRDESRVPVRISSRDSRNQPSTFEPKLGNRSSLHHKGHFVSGKASAVKLLKSWGLKFSGEDKQEDAEDFLDQLNKCVDGAGLAVADILSALPCIFSKRSARWHGTVADRKSADARNQSLVEKKQELKSWRSWRQPSTRSFDLMKKLERPCGRKYGNNSRIRISTNLTHLHTMPVKPSREIILRPWRSNAIDKLAQRDEPLATTFARASITESSTNPTIVEPVPYSKASLQYCARTIKSACAGTTRQHRTLTIKPPARDCYPTTSRSKAKQKIFGSKSSPAPTIEHFPSINNSRSAYRPTVSYSDILKDPVSPTKNNLPEINMTLQQKQQKQQQLQHQQQQLQQQKQRSLLKKII